MSRFTVLCTANAFKDSGAEAEAPIYAAGGEVLYSHRMGPLAVEELIPYLERVDGVIAATDPYIGPVLDACPRLRVIARWGTGYDSVDVPACTERGVAACNAPGMNVETVADYVFGVMLGLARRLPHQIAVMRSGGWEEVRGIELHRKTVGIVGFGGIGKAVARRARGFDCRVVAYDPFQSPDAFAALGAEPATLEQVFSEGDFVTLHASLTRENRGMIGEGLFRRMKPSAFFINAARGPLVDEDALCTALRDGWIAGAAVDAFAEEPLRPDHPFRHLPNCLATPHSAFNTSEASAATNRAVAEAVVAVLSGNRPAFPLNPEVYDLPHFRGRVPLL